MKSITLCADDYGQNPAISQAIIELAKQKRLTATSCLTTSSYWPIHAKWLLPLKDQLQIGLHLNFTQGEALSAVFQNRYQRKLFSLPQLMWRSVFHQLDLKTIEAEIHAQIDRFIDCMTVPPQFVDGHQHVHHFPVIREALLNVYENRLRKSHCRLRSVYEQNLLKGFSRGGFFKKIIIQALGAKSFKQELIKRSIPHNQSFSGVYHFGTSSYGKLFSQFVDEVSADGMIMCHPGMPASTEPDPICRARESEYAFLASDDFLKLCEQKQFNLLSNPPAT